MVVPNTNTNESPPPAINLLVFYTVIGALLSFGFGKEIRTLAATTITLEEIIPTILVISLFLMSYSMLDVIAVANARANHGHGSQSKTFDPMVKNPPEDVHLALRAQANQVEQLPIYLVAALSFSLLVNGTVGAILSAIWAILRRFYAKAYRSSVGKTWEESGVSNYTVPAYIVVNSMLMGTVVHCVRFFSWEWLLW